MPFMRFLKAKPEGMAKALQLAPDVLQNPYS